MKINSSYDKWCYLEIKAISGRAIRIRSLNSSKWKYNANYACAAYMCLDKREEHV